jgi:CDP-diacylglycerol---serine O-phosphatidyltransferase
VREFVNAANVITTGCLTAGFLALMFAADGKLGPAAAAVAVAAVLDSIDGFVARRRSGSGPFGCQLDSLADLVAFGAAPALMLDHGVLQGVPVIGAGACTAFVLAGAWRLARFPLVADRDRFIGLPIPPAGLIAAAAALAGPAVLGVAVTLALALLMVSVIPFPTLGALADLARRGPAHIRGAGTGVRPHYGPRAADATRLRSRGRRRARWRARASRPPRRQAKP